MAENNSEFDERGANNVNSELVEGEERMSKPTLSIMYIYQCLTFFYLSGCLPVFLFIYLSIYLLVYI